MATARGSAAGPFLSSHAFRLSPFASRLTFHESFACGALRSVGTARLAQLSADRVEMYQVKSMLDVIGHDDVGIVLRIEM